MYGAASMAMTSAVQLVSDAWLQSHSNFLFDSNTILVAFPYAGQNIGWRGHRRDYEKTKDTVADMVNSWFTEYRGADMSYIYAYRRHDQG